MAEKTQLAATGGTKEKHVMSSVVIVEFETRGRRDDAGNRETELRREKGQSAASGA